MLAGSTLGLRSVCFQLSSKLLQSPVPFAIGHLTTPVLLPCSTISSAAHQLQSILHSRNGPENHDPSAKNSYQGRNARLPPTGPFTVANGVPYLVYPSFSGMSTTPAGEKGARQVDGVEMPLVAEDHHRTKRKCPAQRRRTLQWIMLTTKSPRRAWSAYQELLSHQVAIPPHLLHRLVRLLAPIKPRSRTLFLQLLSVLKMLQRNHGRLRLWEWNTLMDAAGKQWRKTRLEDYENSFDIFERRGSLPPGDVVSLDTSPGSVADLCQIQQEPDIWTYNILLSVACGSASPLIISHASSLLRTSGLSPNRYTHLCLLRYFAIQDDMKSVRSTLRKMKQQDMEVGLDGINACLWAYARNGRLEVAQRIYRVLRNNLGPSCHHEEHGADNDSSYIRETVGLDDLGGFEPDEITYTMMIQALAYHGEITNALGVFVDMLSTPNREPGPQTNAPVNRGCYKPSMAAFRGLFLGFARHGRDPEHCAMETARVSAPFSSPRVLWDLDTLEAIFAAFLRLPDLPKPTVPVVYWILVAFDKTSGKDPDKLREVWTKLEAKYGSDWGGRLGRIRRSTFLPDDGNV